MNRKDNVKDSEELLALKKHAIKSIIKSLLIILILGILYYIFILITGHPIPCVIHKITGYQCIGCGITRMFLHLSRFRFRMAFHDNAYLFCFGPIIVADILNIVYKDLIGQKTGIITKIISTILVGIAIIFCIIRNI